MSADQHLGPADSEYEIRRYPVSRPGQGVKAGETCSICGQFSAWVKLKDGVKCCTAKACRAEVERRA